MSGNLSVIAIASLLLPSKGAAIATPKTAVLKMKLHTNCVFIRLSLLKYCNAFDKF
jgi:hypothetical protein